MVDKSRLKKPIDWFKYILILPLIVWLGLFVVFPLLDVAVMSFMKSGNYGGVEVGFSLNNYFSLLSPLYLKIIFLSFLLALIVTVISILIA